jgi:hypothetical protein
LLPGSVPRMAGIATLAAAGAALYFGKGSVELTAATVVVAVCMAGARFSRWAALPGLAVAAVGLLQAFLSVAKSGTGVRWDQCAALSAFGLSILAAVMVLVEQRVESCESSSSGQDAGGV